MRRRFNKDEWGYCLGWVGFSIPFNTLAFDYFFSGAQLVGLS
jgi:hypothetical protein